MVKLSKTAVDTDWGYEEDYEIPSEVTEEISTTYDSLEGWRNKKKFLDQVQSEHYGTELENWAKEKEDELEYDAVLQIEHALTPMIREEAKKLGQGKYDDIYFEEIMDRVYPRDLADNIVYKLWNSDEDENSVMKRELDKAIQEKQRDILLGAQEAIKDEVDYESTRDIVRHMQTPKEIQQVEIPTEPKQLENVPSDQGLGSLSNIKNNQIKRGGKMLTELFKLANTLDKKGEYKLASEVDEIIKELSQRAGLTAKEMVSLANELDESGEVELADRLDVVLAKGKYKTWSGPGQKPPVREDIKKPPKGWMDDAKKKIKSKNPEYSAKRINEIAGDMWFNTMSDTQRNKAFKEYGKKGKAQK